MAYRKELTTAEKKERDMNRSSLLAKFPNGVAEIVAICDPREPAVVGRPSLLDLQMPRASSTPAIPVYLETGGTHPGSGMPEVKVRKIDISIWPVSGRTDQAGELSKYYKPIEILEFLADDRMRKNAGRPIYKLVPVSQVVLEAEKKSITNPGSRENFETLRKKGLLVENASETAQPARPAPMVRVVHPSEVEEADDTAYLNDADLNDDAVMVDETEDVLA